MTVAMVVPFLQVHVIRPHSTHLRGWLHCLLAMGQARWLLVRLCSGRPHGWPRLDYGRPGSIFSDRGCSNWSRLRFGCAYISRLI
jgi:hypothetical protein